MKFYFPILCFFLVGCSSPIPTSTIKSIDIEKAFNNHADIFLSDFAHEIEYIQLETLQECVIDRWLKVFTNDKYIVAIAFQQNYLFDRKTGKFIREIGHYGRGANEYQSTSHAVPFDENRNTIRSSISLLKNIEYDLNGNVVRTLNFPPQTKEQRHNMWWEMVSLDDQYFVTYARNHSGNEPDKLIVFDGQGNIFTRFPNYHTYEKNPKRAGSFSLDGQIFNKWRNNVFFYENCVDTLYRVTKDELIPYFQFQLGKYNPPYSEKDNLPWGNPDPFGDNEMCNNFFYFQTINESESFLFFSFIYGKRNPVTGYRHLYFGFYDKELGVTKVSEVDHLEKTPVINDLDDFAPLHPYLWSINDSGEMIAYMEAGDIEEWFEENPEKAKKLPEHLKKFSKLTSEDNPVVVILKLKQ